MIDSPAPVRPGRPALLRGQRDRLLVAGAPDRGVFGSKLLTFVDALGALNPNLNGWMEVNLAQDMAAQANLAEPG